jgi:transcriptional regulator with XRE-family HTH domain
MSTAYEKLLDSDEGRIALAEEHAIGVVGELFAGLLERHPMSRKDLAEKIGVTPGRITQLLDGDANMTLATVARVLCGFGHVLEVSSRRFDDFGCEIVWKSSMNYQYKTSYEANVTSFGSCQSGNQSSSGFAAANCGAT